MHRSSKVHAPICLQKHRLQSLTLRYLIGVVAVHLLVLQMQLGDNKRGLRKPAKGDDMELEWTITYGQRESNSVVKVSLDCGG